MTAWRQATLDFRPGQPDAPERGRIRPCGCIADPVVFGHFCYPPPRLAGMPCGCGKPDCALSLVRQREP